MSGSICFPTKSKVTLSAQSEGDAQEGWEQDGPVCPCL